MKKTVSLLLAVLFIAACFCPVYAQEDASTGTFSVLNYNVDGLPIPKMFSEKGRDPLVASKKIAATIHEMHPDIVAVQEDFNFHRTIQKGIDAKYQTLHIGGIPWGSGLNFYSDFPLYNVHREAWNDAYGVFTDASDELTPKGFVGSSFQIADGVYVDVYDIHADANSGEKNTQARLSQYAQLLSYINTYSAGHAVIITGDFNSYFCEKVNCLEEIFVRQEGFKEAWIECNYDGIYDTGTLPHPDCHKPEWKDNSRWGIWDSAEKMFYRSGDGVTLEALQCDYIRLDDENGVTLSDHSSQLGVFSYTVDRTALHDTRAYKTEQYRPFAELFRRIKYFCKALSLVLRDLPKVIKGEIKIDLDK